MSMKFSAGPPGVYRPWLAEMSGPAAPPVTPAQKAGQKAFLSNACASCHQIRGTPAHGVIGPDLTHMATRSTLASLTIPNNEAELSAWVADPQHIKPGNRMPGLHLRAANYL